MKVEILLFRINCKWKTMKWTIHIKIWQLKQTTQMVKSRRQSYKELRKIQ